VDYLQTALEPGELVTAVRLPAPRRDACYRYDKLARVDGDFAIISTAVVLEFGTDARCTHARLAVGACGPTPIRSAAAEDRLIGSTCSADDVDEAVALLAKACDPIDDVRATAAYRLKVLPRFVSRAISEARGRVE
jgi:carbon-monoxide dehydrogenase medium subunit